jgi:spore coat protein U-like protein
MVTVKKALLGSAAGLALIAVAARTADAVTAQLTVRVTVGSNCSLSGGTLDFGEYTSGQTTHLDAVGTLDYNNCQGNVTIEIDSGDGGTITSRQMTSGTRKLGYQLYRNASRTAIWGQGADAQQLNIVSAGTGKLEIFGRIPKGLNVAPGTYTDTVNVTLTF